MNQYFIHPLDISKIKPSTLDKLKYKFEYNFKEELTLFTKDGYYIVNDNSVNLYTINSKDCSVDDNFLTNYTLYGNKINIHKTENVENLPVHYYAINIQKLYFYSKESKNKMVIEMVEGKVIKLYFVSKDKNLHENNFFFNEDISLYLKSLNV